MMCQTGDMKKICNPRNSAQTDVPYHHGDLRRTLIEAALELVRERREWSFSLREVAKQAGVSHNAPYYHFADKRELLTAVAVVGYETLTVRIAEAAASKKMRKARRSPAGVPTSSLAWSIPDTTGLFSSALNSPEGRPKAVADAAAETRGQLVEVLRRGVQSGVFLSSLSREAEMGAAVVTAWSVVHGFTMLAIDGIPRPGQPIDHLAEKVVRIATRAFLS